MNHLPALVVGVVVLVFIAPTVIFKLTRNPWRAKHVQLASDIQTFRAALGSYRAAKGMYPTTAEGLEVLGVHPLPLDPWTNHYIYRYPGLKNQNGYDLFSAGPDRHPDTDDDDWGD